MKRAETAYRLAVNRLVAGSNPARGANDLFFYIQIGFLPSSYFSLLHEKSVKLALGRSQVVRGYPEVSACPLKLTSDGFRLARELHLRGVRRSRGVRRGVRLPRFANLTSNRFLAAVRRPISITDHPLALAGECGRFPHLIGVRHG